MKLKQLVKLEAPYFHIAVGDTTLSYKLQIQARELTVLDKKRASVLLETLSCP